MDLVKCFGFNSGRQRFMGELAALVSNLLPLPKQISLQHKTKNLSHVVVNHHR